MTDLELLLMNKGPFSTVKHVKCEPYRGETRVSQPYDAEQVAANRKLYPHLFRD